MPVKISYRTDSVGLFKIFWLLWKILGVNTCGNKWISRSYYVLLNVFITIWFPAHLTVGVFLLPLKNEILKNLYVPITCIVCSFKHCFLKLNQLREIEEFLSTLDERTQLREDCIYFNQGPKKTSNRMAFIICIAFVGTGLAAIVSVLLDTDKRLMYPGWFPFDWHSSSILYWLLLLYQFVGLTIAVVQQVLNDTIAPVTLCLMGGHVRLLSMRVAKLGYDQKKSADEHENDLKLCVEDLMKLLRLFKVVEDSLSLVQFSMFFSSGIMISVALVNLIFYVEDLPAFLYYTVFTMAVGIELFPCYYYGTLLQQEFADLPYAIFSCNWIDQPKRFRQEIIIFVEATLRKLTMLGGGIVAIQLESFFAICKMTYSLLVLVIRIK